MKTIQASITKQRTETYIMYVRGRVPRGSTETTVLIPASLHSLVTSQMLHDFDTQNLQHTHNITYK